MLCDVSRVLTVKIVDVELDRPTGHYSSNVELPLSVVSPREFRRAGRLGSRVGKQGMPDSQQIQIGTQRCIWRDRPRLRGS